jgi:hypothetical protein
MSSTIYLCFILILLGVSSILGCRDNVRAEAISTGPCQYEEVMGYATILSVKAAAEENAGCKDAVEICFNFTPTDTSARDTYRFPHFTDKNQRLTVGAGLNPPREWALNMGVISGASLRCVRRELIRGTCTPVVFVFPDLDLTGWEKWCFENTSLTP